MSAKANGGTIRGTVVRDVETPQEYKEAVKHAEMLGLQLAEVDGSGGWQTHDGHPVFIRAGGSGKVDVEKIGRKYFHVEIDGKVEKIQSTDNVRGPGKLRLTFKN